MNEGFWKRVTELQRGIFQTPTNSSAFQEKAISVEEKLEKIRKIIMNTVDQISKGEAPAFTYDKRTTWENIRFEENSGLHRNRNIKTTTVRFDAPTSAKRFSLMMKVLVEIERLLRSGKFCTKRDLFYQDPKFYGSQNLLDEVIDNVACMLEIPRWQLNVLSSSKGCMAGNLVFQDIDGNYVDCSKSVSGIMVPNHINGIHKNMHSDAKLILVVEKDATFQKLLDGNILQKLSPIIMITGKGFPDMNTRMLVKKLSSTFKIPTFALVDADPHGIEIMLVYKYGSRSLSHETEHLAVPCMKWIGVFPSDIQRFRIPEVSLIPLTKADKDKGLELISRPYVSSNLQIKSEILLLLEMQKKAEIQCLDAITPSYLLDVYLPGKIELGGWI